MKTNGFTLLELMIVIVIASVLLALATPSFIDLIESSELTTTTNELVANLNYARSEAIKRNTKISVIWQNQNIIVLPSNCASRVCWLRSGKLLPDDYKINLFQTIDDHYSTTNAITYQGNGTLISSGYIKLCTTDKIKVIRLSLIGHPQIAKDNNHNGLPEIFNIQNNSFDDVTPCL